MMEAAFKEHPTFQREQEKEADLLTLKDPYLARGLRESFYNGMERHAAECQNKPSMDPAAVYKDSDTHPSHEARVDYLTDALCREFPQSHQDLCSQPRNGTCPLPRG